MWRKSKHTCTCAIKIIIIMHLWVVHVFVHVPVNFCQPAIASFRRRYQSSCKITSGKAIQRSVILEALAVIRTPIRGRGGEGRGGGKKQGEKKGRGKEEGERKSKEKRERVREREKDRYQIQQLRYMYINYQLKLKFCLFTGNNHTIHLLHILGGA